jgi:23S rRNA (uracil1939-C5)-methyltransferase
MRLKAETAVYGGYVMGRGKGVVFIKGALPGETVEVEVTEKKRDYSVAIAREVVEPSPFRVEPPCPYFGVCGGCQLQHLAYPEQVAMKGLVLSDALKRIGGIETALPEPLSGEQFGYRHRAQFKLSPEGRIGFFREASRDVVDVKRCLISSGRINELIPAIRGLDLKGVKEVHATDGDGAVALVKGRGFDESLAESFISAGFAGVAFEGETYRGAGHVMFDLHGLKYTVSPWSFFQSNWALNLAVVDRVKEMLSPFSGAKVLDLYSGGGNFSLPLAAEAQKIVCVEENPHSVKDGIRNCSLNGIKNVKFVKNPFERISFKGEAFDIVMVDPPRPGLTKEAMGRLMELAPERILYISCNPSTLARDLKKLIEKYSLQSVRLVDFFPNTYHIEAVALLAKIN